MLQIQKIQPNIHQAHQQSTQQIRKKIQQYSFCLTDKIGRGYTSTVYKGRNDITNQIVAIKVIQLKSLTDQIKKNLLQIQLECFKKINHVNLLKYIDSYQTVNNCYIITEYCQGGDLEKQLRIIGKFNQVQFGNFFKQFIAGYQSFYNAGYIHRDLKPANIFIKGQQIKIADFGMVKKANENPRDSYNVGTPVYMPPESLISNIYTQKSDVWSIGVMCYQLTHGNFPWRGQDERQLKFNIQNVKVNFDYNFVNAELANFIGLCLEKNPYNRISLNQILVHPWVKKLFEAGPIRQINKFDYGIISKNNCIPSPQALVQKNMNVIIPVRNYTVPKKTALNNVPSTTLLELQAVPSIQLLQPNQNLNTINRQLKTQRPTLDTEYAPQPSKRKSSFLQQNRPKLPFNRSPSFTPKKTPLDYLISILNYLRYLYKIYKVISQSKSKLLSDQLKKKLMDSLLKQLIKCLSFQQKVIKAKQNIYQLTGFQQFVNSKKWNTYVNVVQQYSQKYRKVYQTNTNSTKQNNLLQFYRLEFVLKSFLSQLHKKIISNIYSLQNKQNYISLSVRYSVNPTTECFQLMEILDYLITLYHMEQVIYCYGWIIFVEKSQINDIVEGKCVINEDNWSQIWQKLDKKIKVLQNNQNFNIP